MNLAEKDATVYKQHQSLLPKCRSTIRFDPCPSLHESLVERLPRDATVGLARHSIILALVSLLNVNVGVSAEAAGNTLLVGARTDNAVVGYPFSTDDGRANCDGDGG